MTRDASSTATKTLDIRLDADFFDHPKTIALEVALGPDGVVALLRLWTWVRKNRPDGNLAGLTDAQVAALARWRRPKKPLVPVLVEAGFLDRTATGLLCHDWAERQPWAIRSFALSTGGKRGGLRSAQVRRQRSLDEASPPKTTGGFAEASGEASSQASSLPRSPSSLSEGSTPGSGIHGIPPAHARATPAQGRVAPGRGSPERSCDARRFRLDADGFIDEPEIRPEWLDPAYELPHDGDGKGWHALKTRIEAARAAAPPPTNGRAHGHRAAAGRA